MKATSEGPSTVSLEGAPTRERERAEHDEQRGEWHPHTQGGRTAVDAHG
jgi:hypothetical protein